MKIIKEPLLHFLLAGAALFILFSIVNQGRVGSGGSDLEIVVTKGKVKSISLKFTKVWQRPPTKSELDGLIEEYIRVEVLYREALSLGLDAGDEVIRRRLAQKLEFISEDVALQQEPTDSVLLGYYELHKEEFRRETLVTFQHVYLNSEKRGESTRRDASRLLAKLKSLGKSSDFSGLGDASMLSREYTNTTRSGIAGLFGNEFAVKLLSQPLSQWSGPIESAYGLHLVYIANLVDGEIPSFDDIRGVVVREWTFENRIEAKKRFYKTLRGRYDVTIEEHSIDANVPTQLGNTAGL